MQSNSFKLLWLSSITISLLLTSCYDIITNSSLSIKNKTNRQITVLYSNGSNPEVTENNIAYYISDQQVIKPDSSASIRTLGRNDAWHNYINEGRSKMLFIYVFDVDSLKRYDQGYSIQELVNQKKYLKLIKYHEADLNKLCWKIDFEDENQR